MNRRLATPNIKCGVDPQPLGHHHDYSIDQAIDNNAAGDNPYEVETGNLLICPTVSNHA
jgi:hypothetical protein